MRCPSTRQLALFSLCFCLPLSSCSLFHIEMDDRGREPKPVEVTVQWMLPTARSSQPVSNLDDIAVRSAPSPSDSFSGTSTTPPPPANELEALRATSFQGELAIPSFLPKSVVLHSIPELPVWQSTENFDSNLAQDLAKLQTSYGLPEDAVSLVYLESGTSNPSGLFLMADRIRTAGSTIKLPLALVILDEVAQGTFSFEDQICYLESDYEGGSGSIQNQKAGTMYSLRDLMRRMIVESDNIATNMLIRWTSTYLQEDVFVRLCTRYSIPKITSFAQITAWASMQAMQELQTNPRHNPYYSYLNQWLIDAPVTYIGQGFPAGTAFPHKYGLYAQTYSEVLSVQTKRPFSLSIYADANALSEEDVLQYLQAVGKICWAFANR